MHDIPPIAIPIAKNGVKEPRNNIEKTAVELCLNEISDSGHFHTIGIVTAPVIGNSR